MKWFMNEVKHWSIIALVAYTILVVGQNADREYRLDKVKAKISYQYLEMADFKFRAQYPSRLNKPVSYECNENG